MRVPVFHSVPDTTHSPGPDDITDRLNNTDGVFGNSTFANLSADGNLNLTGVIPDEGSNNSFIIVAAIAVLGTIGVMMNSGVLVVVYSAGLVKKDYRMIYYILITVSDMMFALHTIANALSILFKDWFVFRLFAVCVNIHITFGLASYQWSAMCIILLIVDLIWSIKYPFTPDRNKIRFSKISCVLTFFIGINSCFIPFLIWDDSPWLLPFCSIGNVYGPHWNEYQIEAVSMLSLLIFLLIMTSLYLLYQLYKTSDVGKTTTSKQSTDVHRNTPDIKVVGSDNSIRNPVFTDDIGHANPVFDDVQSTIQDPSIGVNHGIAENGWKKPANGKTSDRSEQLTMYEVHRKQFIKSCGTVASFMATYLGCCLPYYFWMAQGIGCDNECLQDTPEKRNVRALIATALYLLPIIDPILYTQRFEVFNKAAMQTARRCFRCSRSSDDTRSKLSTSATT